MTISPEQTTQDPATIAKQLLDFLEQKTKRSWEPDVDLFASGAVSSLFAMELVVHLEKTFDIVIAGPDLVLDNFRTVASMTALVDRLLTGKASGSP